MGMKTYDFSADRLRLSKIYESEIVASFKRPVFDSGKVREVYGNLLFPPLPDNRPYIYGSFVTSIDGKIAFLESPDGSLVAKSNFYDSAGSVSDFWILNMLRSISDAIVIGGNAIRNEPNMRGIIFDDELLRDRVNSGNFPVPLNIVVTGSGDIPLNHRVVVSDDIPLLIVTTPLGRKKLLKALSVRCRDYGHFTDVGKIKGFDKTIPLGVIAIGNRDVFDIALFLKLLRQVGIKMLLIESPSLTVSLMREKLLDEIFLNLSSIFIAGNSPSIGKNGESFTVNNHPHGRVLTIHSHSDYFFYFRYRVMY